MRSERDLLREILVTFGNDPRLRIHRLNTGVAQHGARFVRYGIPGGPDIIGILRGGRAIGIETKAARGAQSEQQRRFQRVFEEYGGLYVLARSVDDVSRALSCTDPADPPRHPSPAAARPSSG